MWALKFFFNLFKRERERERERMHTSRGGTEREGERIPSRLRAVSTEPEGRLDPMNCEITT